MNSLTLKRMWWQYAKTSISLEEIPFQIRRNWIELLFSKPESQHPFDSPNKSASKMLLARA